MLSSSALYLTVLFPMATSLDTTDLGDRIQKHSALFSIIFIILCSHAKVPIKLMQVCGSNMTKCVKVQGS